jgi:hypothetical protein
MKQLCKTLDGRQQEKGSSQNEPPACSALFLEIIPQFLNTGVGVEADHSCPSERRKNVYNLNYSRGKTVTTLIS